jgi:hypothetical protein
MSIVTIIPFAASVTLFKGVKGCPFDVAIAMNNIPGGGPSKLTEAIFICKDKARLDGAQLVNPPAPVTGSGFLSEGVCIGQFLSDFAPTFKNITRIVLEDIEDDIYARACYFNGTGFFPEFDPFFVSVEAFPTIKEGKQK